MREIKGSNALIVQMSYLGEKDINALGRIEQDESLPKRVRQRAHFKIACIWKEYDRKQVIVRKAKATRARNKALKELVIKERSYVDRPYLDQGQGI